MKIMYYCQHVLGIGHFFRSMEIAKALAPHQVLFVEGGDPLPGYRSAAHIQRVFLPPLMMDESFTTIETHGADLQLIQEERKQLLLSYFNEFQPDVLIIELFPFGRKRFSFELLPLLKITRAAGKTKVVCSLRDILVEKENQEKFEERALNLLNTYFDLLLVHSDPHLIRLDETFTRTDAIVIPIHYTGFVVRPVTEISNRRTMFRSEQSKRWFVNGEMRKAGTSTDPKRLIVASNGGGKVGAELLLCSVDAFQQIEASDLHLKIFIGPFMDERKLTQLRRNVANDPRISLHAFSLDFVNELNRAELLISMAGYNTCMDILATGVRAIVFPFSQNREQAMRARKLEAMGLVRILEKPQADELKMLIEKYLLSPTRSPKSLQINICGARKSAEAIEKYFKNE